MTAVPVPPVTIRPSVEMDAGAGSNEDDITMKLMVHTLSHLTLCGSHDFPNPIVLLGFEVTWKLCNQDPSRRAMLDIIL